MLKNATTPKKETDMNSETSPQGNLETAQEQLAALRERYESLTDAIEHGRETLPWQSRDPGTTPAAAPELLDNPVVDPGPQTDPDRLDRLERDRRIVAEAVWVQRGRVLDLQRDRARTEYQRRRPEHDTIVRRLCDAVENLHDAILTEQDFRAEFAPLDDAGGIPQPSWKSIPELPKIALLDRGAFRADQAEQAFDVGGADR